MKAYRGRRSMTPLNLNLAAMQRWVDIITPRPLYSLARSPVSVEEEAGWDPKAGLDISEKKKVLLSSGFEPQRVMAVPWSLYRLLQLYSLVLPQKMEALVCAEMSIGIYQATWRYIGLLTATFAMTLYWCLVLSEWYMRYSHPQRWRELSSRKRSCSVRSNFVGVSEEPVVKF
jgi:hypothetical protein